MPKDGEIDYRSYTRAQLEEAASRIDARAYPRNHANLLAELALRAPRAEPVGATATAPSASDAAIPRPEPPPTPLERAFATPLARRLVRVTIAIGCLAIGLEVFAGDLVPSDAALRLAAGAALISAFLGFILGRLRYGPIVHIDDPAFRQRAARRPWILHPVRRGLVMAALGAGLGYGGTLGTVWAWTASEGRPVAVTYVVERWPERSWRCPRVRLESVPVHVRRGFCALPPQRPGTVVRVEGAATPFGIRAERVTILR